MTKHIQKTKYTIQVGLWLFHVVQQRYSNKKSGLLSPKSRKNYIISSSLTKRLEPGNTKQKSFEEKKLFSILTNVKHHACVEVQGKKL